MPERWGTYKDPHPDDLSPRAFWFDFKQGVKRLFGWMRWHA